MTLNRVELINCLKSMGEAEKAELSSILRDLLRPSTGPAMLTKSGLQHHQDAVARLSPEQQAAVRSICYL